MEGQLKPQAARETRTMFCVMAYPSKQWQQHAEHARIMTDRMRGPRAKVAMMSLAVIYEMLAVRTELRELAELADKLAKHEDE